MSNRFWNMKVLQVHLPPPFSLYIVCLITRIQSRRSSSKSADKISVSEVFREVLLPPKQHTSPCMNQTMEKANTATV